MPEIQLITLDPGHFHAALIQKQMYAGVARLAHVYASLGPDLLAHLNRILLFNSRAQEPTNWELEVHAGPDSLERMLAERPGNVVVFSGRNRTKMDRIHASVDAGLNVLADKPWVLRSEDLPKLEAALEAADRKGLIAYDVMTERFEITSIIQRELVNDPAVFGEIVPGNEREPAVEVESVHHLMKTVAGVPLQRPPWFFDIREQGEGLTDVGTHLVDMVQWTLLPGQAVDWRADIHVLDGRRWPTVMTHEEFGRVTGEADFPAAVSEWVKDGQLEYFCNNLILYALRGVHVKLNVLWNYEAPVGAGDTHFAVYRGTKARVEVRQGPDEKYQAELYVVPNTESGRSQTLAALEVRLRELDATLPGLALEDQGSRFRVLIPDRHRIGHEAHFAQVTKRFFQFLNGEVSLPAWEKPNMLAKYYVTTKGVELSHARAAGLP